MTESTTNEPRAEVLRTRDLVGWDVADADGAKVGEVTDLLIGRDGRVRFMAVKLGLLGRTVLVPADALDWGAGSMVLPRWTGEEVKALPPYDGKPLTAAVLDDMERAYPRYYGHTQALPLAAHADAGEPRVVPLRDAKDFRLAKGAPNLRGWNVFGADHERVGQVHEMLVDPVGMKVRYLDVDLADDLFPTREDRHVLIPLELVELRERGEDAWVRGVSSQEIAQLPAYLGGPVDPLVEAQIHERFGGGMREGRPPIVHDDAGAPPPLPEGRA